MSDDLEIGNIQWHSSDEDAGPDVGILLRISQTAHLWAGEISRSLWERADDEARDLGADLGWWLVLYEDGNEGRVLGRCADRFSAADMLDILAAAIRSHAHTLPSS